MNTTNTPDRAKMTKTLRDLADRLQFDRWDRAFVTLLEDSATLLEQDKEDEKGWQLIETAPKDGEDLLLLSRFPSVGRWDNDKYSKRPRPFWKLDTVMGVIWQHENQPSHWMPIPPNPVSAMATTTEKGEG